jgi:hypothetical protein
MKKKEISQAELLNAEKVRETPIGRCEPYEKFGKNSAKQSSAEHFPERTEEFPLDTGTYFDRLWRPGGDLQRK